MTDPRRLRSRGVGVLRVGACCVALMLLAGAATSADTRTTERELAEVRARIESLREALQRDAGKRDALTARLRDAELLAASLNRNIARIRNERESSEARQQALSAERDRRVAELGAERESLGRQLRMAYVSGRQEQLRMLLNQDDPARLGRMMVYYRYLGAQRAQRIEQVRVQLAEIARLEEAVAAESARLAELEQARTQELQALERARAERRELLSALEARIDAQGAEIAQMQRREQNLVALLEELQRALAEFPVQVDQAFPALKGALSWPVTGVLLADYGEQRAGGRIRWQGVLIGATRGAPVRAIANGRVAFADWLPGLGLLVIVEHGNGYMSLYAHNDTLTKAAGDWVAPGDQIGTVGDSGGRSQPALYFEIRRGKAPQDPRPWFGKRLARR